ncbi:MAG: hypothetical protein WCF18_00495, partial [Chthoniobacteraceae bacterium]
MPWVSTSKTRRWIKNPLLWLGLAAFVCGVLLVLPRAQKRYRSWVEVRGIQRAAQALHRGDFKQAVVDARAVLNRNPHSSEATRIIAKSLEALKSPQALVWRRELDAIQADDAENLLGLVEASLNGNDLNGAGRALKRIKPEGQKTARFHDLAAKVARRNRENASAETHWLEAVRLEPNNDEFRLSLAGVQVESREEATRAAALEMLEKMAADPAKPAPRVTALRTLINDAARRSETGRVKELAGKLAADPAAEFSDLLARLRVLRTANDPKSIAYLGELQELAAPDADKVVKLVTFMNENNLALAALEWESKLAPEIAARPVVCAALADSYACAADWRALKAKIEGATWGDFEFLRLAFMSRALDRLEGDSAAQAAWNNALAAAQARPEWLEMLGRAAKGWGWKPRAEETLWKLAGDARCPQWVLDYLWTNALARSDTAKLFEASKLFVKADHSNVAMRNNYIAIALLTGQTADAPHELAEELFKQNPGEVIIASTYGLALMQRGKPADAVAVMEKFSAEDLRDPVAATYYAIFLAAAGQAERADEYFRIGATAKLLPEETAMVAILAPVARARALDRSGDALGSHAAWQGALAAAADRPEWLEKLGRMAFDWQWQPKAEAVVLKLAALDRCPAWAGETLWRAALKSADAAQIYRAGRLLSEADPSNLAIRNRFLSVALLTGREADAPQRQIAALARANPQNVEIAATYGLALYQQGKADEALALLNNFTPEQLRAPPVALCQGVFLSAVGRKDEAAPFLQIASSGPLMAEEKALIANARAGTVPSSAARSASPAPPAAVAQPIDRTRSDTAQLFKEARDGLVADSKNVIARGNYI